MTPDRTQRTGRRRGRLSLLALCAGLTATLAGCSNGSSDLEDLLDRDQQPEDEFIPDRGSTLPVEPGAPRFVGEFVGEGDPVTFYAMRWEGRQGSCLIVDGPSQRMACAGTIGGVTVGIGGAAAQLLAPGVLAEDLDGDWVAISEYVAIAGGWG